MIERYMCPKMGAIWLAENKFRTWLQVEVAVARVEGRPREALPKGMPDATRVDHEALGQSEACL